MKLEVDEQKEFYEQIIKFYDLAEGIIDAVEADVQKKPEVQVDLVCPIIDQVEESAEIIAESYMAFIENGQHATPYDTRRVESAFRKLFSKILEFTSKLEKIPV